MQKKLKPSAWVTTTYFLEGLPYMLVRSLSSVFFTDLGLREAYLGLLNFLGIPWNLKFLWAPFLDAMGTRKGWIQAIQLVITLLTGVIAILAGFYSQEQNSSILTIMAFIFVFMAFFAATNDVAIDAYYLEGLNTDEQAAYTGLRTLAYRLAVVFARSLLVAIAGYTNWVYGFGVGAGVMALLLVIHQIWLPSFTNHLSQKPNIPFVVENFKKAFAGYLKRDKVFIIILFIITYKLGDEILFSMNTPFLMRELLVSKQQLAWLSGIVGAATTVVGSLLGGYWIRKKTFEKAIWPITIIMNVTILAYILLSEGFFKGTSTMGISVIAFIHGYENLASGLGSAALTVYLMRLCDINYKATHYAIGTAIMSLGSTVFGGFSGYIVEQIGYTNLFLLGFFCGIPSMILLKFLPLQKKS